MKKQKYYTVIVYNQNNQEVDIRENVLAWNRREAYFEVMNEMKLHNSWDAFDINTGTNSN